ncbi:hypothetical protein GGR51DRAFT_468530 [Nemania sp. FL0031]|nr:hypothetical protein GGR51DRAFT_468530 [Nemania sp. FL0031]
MDLFNACGSYPFKALDGHKEGCLPAKGIVFDIVERISQSDDANDYCVKLIRDWRNMAGIEKDPGPSYPSGGSVMDAFWRTLSLDLSVRNEGPRPYERASTEDRAKHHHYWFLGLSFLYGISSERDPRVDGYVNTLESSAFARHMANIIKQRRLFFSKKGYMGLAPKTVEEGDMICVLAGGNLPFILRETKIGPDDCSEAKMTCTLVGDAYLYGIMDGAAVRGIKTGEGSFRTFCLVLSFLANEV